MNIEDPLFSITNPIDTSYQEKEANALDAFKLEAAIKAGKKIVISNAIIVGDISLRFEAIEGEIVIEGSEIRGTVDFSFATFKQTVNFEQSTFLKDVSFLSAKMQGNVSLNGALFEGTANFYDFRISGIFYSIFETRNTQFKKGVNFEGASFGKKIEFHQTIFNEKAIFDHVQISGNVEFPGAEFKNGIQFSNATVNGIVFFRAELEGEGTVNEPAVIGGNIDFIQSSLLGIQANEVVFEQDINFVGANINGDVHFDDSTIKGNVNFNSAKIQGYAFFRNTKFIIDPGPESNALADFGAIIIDRSADFTDSEFNSKVTFNSSNIYGSAFFKGVKFLCEPEGNGFEVDFISASIGGNAEFDGAQFNGNVSFNSTKINGSAFFKKSIFLSNPELDFDSFVDFGSSVIGGSTEFTDSEFNGLVSFNGAKIQGGAFFHRAKFLCQPKSSAGIDVNFISATIDGNAEFDAVQFEGNVSFNSAKIQGSVFFVNVNFVSSVELEFFTNADFGATVVGGSAEFSNSEFNGIAIFNSCKIQGSAFFRGTKFLCTPKSRSELGVDFILASIEGNAEFNNALFKGNVSFYSAFIGGQAYFFSAAFESGGSDLVSFNLVKFFGEVYFSDARFDRNASFKGVQCHSDFYLQRTNFNKDVSFQNSSFKTIVFDDFEPLQFPKGVDMRGCYYDRIEPINYWKDLINAFNPYDRQPYSQLESTVRASGDDDLANRIYFERERGRAKWIKKHKTAHWRIELFKDKIFRFTTGYGVKTWLLMYYLIPLLAIGTFLFQQKGAVQIKDAGSSVQATTQLSVGDAFWLTLDSILPISIQSGSDWKASNQSIFKFKVFNNERIYFGLRYSDVATLFTIFGWVIIPIGLAGITGLLKKP